MKARQDTPLDVVVIGGGIAGLAATAALADNLKPCLVEREPVLASHASGRNAAIFRPLESESTTSALAQRSMQLMDSQLGLAHQGSSAVQATPWLGQPCAVHMQIGRGGKWHPLVVASAGGRAGGLTHVGWKLDRCPQPCSSP